MASSNTASNGADGTSLVSYTCRSCQKETAEPFKTTCICKKTYCPECKEKEPQTDAQCPTCTEQLSFFKVALGVRCRNVTNGCVWVGPPNQMDDHIKKKCRHCPCEHCQAVGLLANIQGRHVKRCHPRPPAGVKRESQGEEGTPQLRCSHGCSWVGLTRREQQNHNRTCQLKVVKCSECQLKITLLQKKEHRKTCPYVNYTCVYCGVKGQFTMITGGHLSRCKGLRGTTRTNPPATSATPEGTLATDSGSTTTQSSDATPGEVAVCPYAQIGCLASVKPEELEEHKAKCVKDHLDLAMQVVHSLQVAMERMQQQISQGSSPKNLPPTFLTPPRTFQLTQYGQKCQDHEQWFSPAFYSGVGGYQMCLRIDASGDGDGRDTHTSVFLCVMKGEYDDHLVWPFYGKVTIDLLNQLEDCNHYTKVISFSENTPQACCERVRETERSRTGFGFSMFVSHRRLELDSEANIHYLKDDCLFIRVRSVTVSSTNRPWLMPTN